jgi:hypothetical protein
VGLGWRGESGEETAGWEGAVACLGDAWPGHGHSGRGSWRVTCTTRRREAATTAPAGRRRTRVAVGPGCPSRVRPRRGVIPDRRPGGRAGPRRLGGLADAGENPPYRGGLGNEGDDAHSVRYRLDCRRSCSRGQRPQRVLTARQAAVTGPRGSDWTLAVPRRQPAAVRPGQHVAGVVGLEQPTVGEPAHHPAADLLFDRSNRFWRQCPGLSELEPARRRRLAYTLPGVQARRVSGPTRGRTRPRG